MAVDKNGKQLPKGITQRADGLYMGRFTYAGKRYTLYDKSSPKKLEKAVNEMRYELEHGIYCPPKELTVGDWFDIWIGEYKANTTKKSTVQTYTQSYRKYIQPEIGKQKLSDMRPQALQKIINDMYKKGFSKSRTNFVYVIFQGMFKQAQRNQIIMHNPADSLTFPKFKKKQQSERRVMTLREQQLFLSHAEGSKYYTFYLLALSTGMRINEMLALQWSDVDFKNNEIHVNGTLVYLRNGGGRFKDTPKTESSRRGIPMLGGIRDTLKKLRKQQFETKVLMGDKWQESVGLENLVLTYEGGGALWDTGIRVDMKNIVQSINEAGGKMEPITPHTFRHTFATRGLEQGIDLKIMQSILGHSSLAMTADLYSHVLPDTKALAMKKLEGIF